MKRLLCLLGAVMVLTIAVRASDLPKDLIRAMPEQAEELLYSDCIVFPMFYEISYILFAPDVTGIEIYPYGGMVLFKDAVAMR